jgi:hypothetical protein
MGSALRRPRTPVERQPANARIEGVILTEVGVLAEVRDTIAA